MKTGSVKIVKFNYCKKNSEGNLNSWIQRRKSEEAVLEGRNLLSDNFNCRKTELDDDFVGDFSSVEVYRLDQDILTDVITVLELSESQISEIESAEDNEDILNKVNNSANKILEDMPSLNQNISSPIIWWSGKETKDIVNEETAQNLIDNNRELFENYYANFERSVSPASLLEFSFIVQKHSVIAPWKGLTILEVSDHASPVGRNSLPKEVFSKTTMRLNTLYRAYSWQNYHLDELKKFSDFTRESSPYDHKEKIFEKNKEWVDLSTKIRDEKAKIGSYRTPFNFDSEKNQLFDEIILSKNSAQESAERESFFWELIQTLDAKQENLESKLELIEKNFESISSFLQKEASRKLSKTNNRLQHAVIILTAVLLVFEFIQVEKVTISRQILYVFIFGLLFGYLIPLNRWKRVKKGTQ